MPENRSIFSYVATSATIHPGKDGRSPSIWFETVKGPVRIELPATLACELADNIAAAFRLPPPEPTRE